MDKRVRYAQPTTKESRRKCKQALNCSAHNYNEKENCENKKKKLANETHTHKVKNKRN